MKCFGGIEKYEYDFEISDELFPEQPIYEENSHTFPHQTRYTPKMKENKRKNVINNNKTEIQKNSILF